MRKELEDKLIDKYPELFEDKDKPPTESLMCYGCECDDGWFDILNGMCRQIYQHINSKKENRPSYRFTQIKEKFAGLRVYGIGSDDYIDGVVDMAESISYHTCEVCGDKGFTMSSGFWLKTLCEKHASEMGYSRKQRE